MTWPRKELDTQFNQEANRDIVHFLKTFKADAHDAAWYYLKEASKGLEGVRYFTPAKLAIQHTESGIIYAVGYGMSNYIFRLPEDCVQQVIAEGGTKRTAIGPEWVELSWPPSNLKHWCRIAHQHAMTL